MRLEDALKEWDGLDMDEGMEPDATLVSWARRVANLPPWDLGGMESERMADLRRAAKRGALAPFARDIAWLLDIADALDLIKDDDG